MGTFIVTIRNLHSTAGSAIVQGTQDEEPPLYCGQYDSAGDSVLWRHLPLTSRFFYPLISHPWHVKQSILYFLGLKLVSVVVQLCLFTT